MTFRVVTLAAFGAAALLTDAAHAAEFFVAPAGNDANVGTAESPFATPGQAQLASRQVIAAGLNEAVTVTLRGGTYRLAKPLEMTVADGGTAGHAVVWRAAPGERVVFSGGKVLTGGSVWPDGLWRVAGAEAQVGGRFRELFLNGVRRPRARFPNDGYLRVREAGADKRTSFTTEPNVLPAIRPAGDAELVFLHDWSISRVPVQAVDPAGGMVALAGPIGASQQQFAIDNFEPHPRFFLENDPTVFDLPGEWFFDRPTGLLVYRPLPGETAEAIQAVVPVSPALVVVRGDEATGTPVRNLHFAGIEFEHAAWLPPGQGYAGIQAGFYEARSAAGGGMSPDPVPAAVSFRVAEGCSLSDSAVRHVGGSGVEFGSRCRNCVLARTVVQDVSADGVIIGEGGHRAVGGQAWWRSAPGQVPTGNVVEDCLIERCGAQYFGAVGIWAGLNAGLTVRRNLVRDVPYTGVSLGWQWDDTPTPARDNRVERNHIHGVMKVLSDGGGIYTLGLQPGTALAGNLIHGVPVHAGKAESDGMFLDEGTTGLLIEGNVIYDIEGPPLRFHKAGENVVRGNTLTLSGDAPPVRYNNTPEANVRLEGNAVVPNEGFAVPDPAAFGAGPSAEVLARLLERAK